MTGAQNRGNIENINKYIKLAPLPFRGAGGQKIRRGIMRKGWVLN